MSGTVGIPATRTFTAPEILLLVKGGMIRKIGSVIVGENLTKEFGKGFDERNLRKMRQFYCAF